jgi:DNA end-binding protein Ku
MARALWSGSLSFGLVSVPVDLRPAEDRRDFSFTMLDKHDLSPVGYKRYNKSNGKEVAWGDIVKGHEYEDGRYVVLTEADFKKANVKATQTIDIHTFVKAGDVPVWFYETPYYLVPGKRGAKSYALLRETLRDTGLIAVAQIVLHTTQHLAAITVNGSALMLVIMRYAGELRGTKGLELPPAGMKDAGVTAKDLQLAKRLVDDLTAAWDPSDFVDTYHRDLLALIKKKIKRGDTERISEPEEKAERETGGGKVLDLTALLKRSLAGKPAAAARHAPVRRRKHA